MRPTILLLCAAILASAPLVGRGVGPPADPTWLGRATPVAGGVELFRVDATMALAAEAAPRSLRLLRLDPRRVRLAAALATGVVPGRATVADIARRAKAIAAVNAGFFGPTGDPNGLLKIDGRLLSDTGRARGAVAIENSADGVSTMFDQVSGRVRLRFKARGAWQTVPVDGVDTHRGAGALVLYTPASGATTGTQGGTEWVLRGTPLRASPAGAVGDTSIPQGGYVLSYGGSTAPPVLRGLLRAPAVQVREAITVVSRQRARDWMRARTIVGGAGLLLRNGQPLREWSIEKLARGFDTTTHPRTLIARDRRGRIWLITVDGRQPGRAVGASFADLHALLGRIDAVDALNLDGGGSTTMVVGEDVVNRPSDPVGPRPVSDALIVTAR